MCRVPRGASRDYDGSACKVTLRGANLEFGIEAAEFFNAKYEKMLSRRAPGSGRARCSAGLFRHFLATARAEQEPRDPRQLSGIVSLSAKARGRHRRMALQLNMREPGSLSRTAVDDAVEQVIAVKRIRTRSDPEAYRNYLTHTSD